MHTGPARYLASLIPRSASHSAPSVQLLHGILQRASLQRSTIALASCMLDCLTPTFVRSWRRECVDADGASERPEVIAVAALSLALKFVEDTSYSARRWTRSLAADVWDTRSHVTTERLILADIDYAVVPLCRKENMDWNLAELERCDEAVRREREEWRQLDAHDDRLRQEEREREVEEKRRCYGRLGTGDVFPVLAQA